MADENSNAGAPGDGGSQDGQTAMPSIQIAAQYIKDLSFENPSMGLNVRQPQIEFSVDLQARKMQDGGPYEVIMKIRVTANQDDKTIFLLELAYGGVFILERVPEDAIQPLLLIECPRMMFPFLRRIVADLVSDGGLPPLMIEPIDFAQLYRSRLARAAAEQQGQQIGSA
jgi:preprotein translocase subunit SecB